MALGGILVIGLMIAYSTIISISLASMGTVNVLPTISALVCSVITLILTFLKSSGVLIGLRDYDMVMSLPVKNPEVVLSRLTMVYLKNLLISVIVVLPSVVIFGINSEVGISGNTMFLLSFFISACNPYDCFFGAWCFDFCRFFPVKTQKYSFIGIKYTDCIADCGSFCQSAEHGQ